MAKWIWSDVLFWVPGAAGPAHLEWVVLFVLLAWGGFAEAQTSSIILCGCSEGGGGMFYACLNMHLKSKSIRNDSENAKGFHQSLLIHDALRKATYFRANSCYHLGSTHPTEVIFHLRTCTLMTVWGAAAGMDTHKSMFSTHAISKWRGRREYSI